MLQIPFLSNYIEKIVQRQLVADTVDYLNYYVTSLLLAFFSFAISCKQYFGSPLQCWVPMEFRGGWEKYAEDYCFISNAYHVPMEDNIQDGDRGDHISYYRWVPIVLALQAIGFYLPNYIWAFFHKNTAINPRQFIEEAAKINNLSGEAREKEINTLANEFLDQVSVFGLDRNLKRRFLTQGRNGWNATACYLTVKLLYVLNVICQMYILNAFFNGSFFSWGSDALGDIVHGRQWTEDVVFPRVIYCDFSVRAMAQMRRYTVQCVIMMNMINEKLYLFLFVWFIFLIALTLASFLYYLLSLGIPSLRRRMVNVQIDEKFRFINRNQRARFVTECLHADGVLLLSFIREHAGGRVASELTNKLLSNFSRESSMTSSGEHSPSDMEKRPLTNGFSNIHHMENFDRYDPPPKHHGGEASYPLLGTAKFGTPMKSAQIVEGSAPPMDYDRYSTLRAGDFAPRASPRTAPPPNAAPASPPASMDQPDTGRNATPTDV